MRNVITGRLWVLLAIVWLAPVVRAADCSAPIQLPEKPRMDDFADYDVFLREVLDYKATKRERVHHKQLCPGAYQRKARPNQDPTVVTGSESLSQALQRTRRIKRRNRSSGSADYSGSSRENFPLPDLSRRQMESDRVGVDLGLMRASAEPQSGSQLLPLVYTTTLNTGRTNGDDAQSGEALYFYNQLPEMQSRANAAWRSDSRAARLAYISKVQDNERGKLTIVVGRSGNPLNVRGTVYTQFPGPPPAAN